MQHSFIDIAIWLLAFVGEVILLATLIFFRHSRSFPLFTALIALTALRDVLLFPIYRYCSKDAYFIAYWSSAIPNYFLQFGILYEIARNIFSSDKKSIPDWAARRLWALVPLSILATASIITNTKFTSHRWINNFVDSVDLTITILQTLLFLSIVAISGILKMPWKSPVQKIVTGLAIFSLIDLVSSYGYVISHLTWFDYYHRVAYLVSLGYWIGSLTVWSQFFVLATALLLAGMKGWQKLGPNHNASWESLRASIRSSDTLRRTLDSLRSSRNGEPHAGKPCAEDIRIKDLSGLYHNAGIYAKLAQHVLRNTSTIPANVIDEICAEAAQVRLLVIFALGSHLAFHKTSCQVNTYRAVQLYDDMARHVTNVYKENSAGILPTLTKAV